MSYLLEVYYRPPADAQKEEALTSRLLAMGGRLTYREAPKVGASRGICLSYEFAQRDQAAAAARLLRDQGEHVEGPVDYGGEMSPEKTVSDHFSS
jgi:hypothetical protein